MDVVALLRDLVAARSPSREEGPAADLVEAWLQGKGEVLRRDRNVALIRRMGPGPTLLVCSHHDTVPATSAWTRDPWSPEVEGGRLYGLGSNDAKGCVAAMAVACASANFQRGTLVFAAVCEEEVGRGGLEAFLPELPAPDTAIIGEPTGLDIAISQSGLLVLDCVNRGRAGHAARPSLADNPIPAMARDIVALGDFPGVVTMVQAGERHNVIPAEAKWTIDVRTRTEHAALIAAARKRVSARINVRSDRFRPVSTPPDAPILRAAQRARPTARTFDSPTLSDWAHLGHIPAIKWGPGLSEISHTADEWVELAMVEAAVGAYRRCFEEVLS